MFIISPEILASGQTLKALSQQLDFSSGNLFYQPTTVSAPLTFTIKNPTQSRIGATVWLHLTADGLGANIPNFSAFTSLKSSAGWDNTSGILNIVQITYTGLGYYLVITQPLEVSPPAVTLLNTPLSQAATTFPYSFTLRITDAVGINQASITASAFEVRRPDDTVITATVNSITGGTTQKDVVLQTTPNLVGSYTIKVLANAIQGSSGKFATAATLGTFSAAVDSAPTLQSIVLNSNEPARILLNYSEEVSAALTGTASAFSVEGRSVSLVSRLSAQQIAVDMTSGASPASPYGSATRFRHQSD